MNPAVGSVDVDADGVLRLVGHIGYANAGVMLPRGRAALADGRVSRVDLSALQAPDSATMAVLLVWAAEASRSKRTLRVTGMPDGLRALIRLCDAEALLQAA